MATIYMSASGRDASTVQPINYSLVYLYSSIGIAAVAGVTLLQHVFPILYVYLIAEDRFGEFATALSFAMAGPLFLLGGMKSSGLARALLIAGAGICVGIAGEEVSWGQRILGVETPEFIKHGNSQGELTLHNLALVQHAPYHMVVGLALGIAVMLAFLLSRQRALSPLIRQLPRMPLEVTPLAALTSLLLIFRPFVKGDEIAEMFLGITVLAWGASYFVETRQSGIQWKFAATVMVAMLVGSGVLTTAFGRNMSSRYNMTAARDYPNAHMYKQADELFRFILNDPRLVRSDTRQNYELVKRAARINMQLNGH